MGYTYLVSQLVNDYDLCVKRSKLIDSMNYFSKRVRFMVKKFDRGESETFIPKMMVCHYLDFDNKYRNKFTEEQIEEYHYAFNKLNNNLRAYFPLYDREYEKAYTNALEQAKGAQNG